MSYKRLSEVNPLSLFAIIGGMLLVLALVGRDEKPKAEDEMKEEETPKGDDGVKEDDVASEKRGTALLSAGDLNQGLDTGTDILEVDIEDKDKK